MKTEAAPAKKPTPNNVNELTSNSLINRSSAR